MNMIKTEDTVKLTAKEMGYAEASLLPLGIVCL